MYKMNFSVEQLKRGIARHEFLANDYRSRCCLSLSIFYAKRAKELKADLLALESKAVETTAVGK